MLTEWKVNFMYLEYKVWSESIYDQWTKATEFLNNFEDKNLHCCFVLVISKSKKKSVCIYKTLFRWCTHVFQGLHFIYIDNRFFFHYQVLSGFDEDFEDPLVVVDSYPDQVRSIPIRDLSMIGDNPSQFQNKHRGMRISFKDGVLSGPVSKRDPLTCFFNIVACYG